MNKKGFLYSFLLFAFSFIFICNVKALEINGIEITEELVNTAYAQIDGKTWNDYNYHSVTMHKDTLPYYDIHYENGYLVFKFFNVTTVYKDGSYWYHSKGSYYMTAKALYNVNNRTWSGSRMASDSEYAIFSNSYPIYSNFIITDNNGNPININSYYQNSISFSLPNFVFNFHLNGGQVFDTSDIMNPILHQEDFTYSGTSDEIHEYITHLTFMKSNSDYIGLYYDSAFTQAYNPTDTIDSDKDIYIKFQSKIYNVNNVDYYEFKFDNLPLMEKTISFDYNFKTVTQNGENETIQFSAPYGHEYYTGCDDEGQNCSTDTKFQDKLFYDLDYINYDYSGSKSFTFNSSPDHITNSFSVIIPTEQLRGTYLYIDFDSEQDYEMIIHYKDDEGSNNSFIRTVDISGKYGAIFLPLYDNSNYAEEGSYYLTKFKVIGNVDIQVTDSRDLTNYNILQLYSMNYCNNQYLTQENNNAPEGSIYLDTSIPYSCDNLSGVFNFKIDNLTAKQTLRFVNHAYTELSDRRTIIEYDTRYFNYGILDTPYSTTQIEDPTTHEIETVGLSEFYNQLDKASIAGSKLTFQNAFNRFVNPIKFLFSSVTSIFNNYLSSSLQHYFFLIFSMTIIILIIRVIF